MISSTTGGKRDLNIADYDLAYLHKRDSMAFEMAENGDSNAISALQRIIALDRNPEKVKKSQRIARGIGPVNSIRLDIDSKNGFLGLKTFET